MSWRQHCQHTHYVHKLLAAFCCCCRCCCMAKKSPKKIYVYRTKLSFKLSGTNWWNSIWTLCVLSRSKWLSCECTRLRFNLTRFHDMKIIPQIGNSQCDCPKWHRTLMHMFLLLFLYITFSVFPILNISLYKI